MLSDFFSHLVARVQEPESAVQPRPVTLFESTPQTEPDVFSAEPEIETRPAELSPPPLKSPRLEGPEGSPPPRGHATEREPPALVDNAAGPQPIAPAGDYSPKSIAADRSAAGETRRPAPVAEAVEEVGPPIAGRSRPRLPRQSVRFERSGGYAVDTPESKAPTRPLPAAATGGTQESRSRSRPAEKARAPAGRRAETPEITGSRVKRLSREPDSRDRTDTSKLFPEPTAVLLPRPDVDTQPSGQAVGRFMPTQPPLPAAPRTETSTIHVTIGRVEVRAALNPSPSKKTTAKPAPMSLEEYLKQRSGERR